MFVFLFFFLLFICLFYSAAESSKYGTKLTRLESWKTDNLRVNAHTETIFQCCGICEFASVGEAVPVWREWRDLWARAAEDKTALPQHPEQKRDSSRMCTRTKNKKKQPHFTYNNCVPHRRPRIVFKLRTIIKTVAAQPETQANSNSNRPGLHCRRYTLSLIKLIPALWQPTMLGQRRKTNTLRFAHTLATRAIEVHCMPTVNASARAHRNCTWRTLEFFASNDHVFAILYLLRSAAANIFFLPIIIWAIIIYYLAGIALATAHGTQALLDPQTMRIRTQSTHFPMTQILSDGEWPSFLGAVFLS